MTEVGPLPGSSNASVGEVEPQSPTSSSDTTDIEPVTEPVAAEPEEPAVVELDESSEQMESGSETGEGPPLTVRRSMRTTHPPQRFDEQTF